MLITNMRSQKSHVGKSTKNILQNRIPILPRKIQVKIGRIASIQVNKTLKKQIQFQGIHIRNKKQVRHQAVGPASPTHIKESRFPGKFEDLPIDQKISYITLLSYDHQLFFQTLLQFSGRICIPMPDPGTSQKTQKAIIHFLVAGVPRKIFVWKRRTDFKINTAFIQQPRRPVE